MPKRTETRSTTTRRRPPTPAATDETASASEVAGLDPVADTNPFPDEPLVQGEDELVDPELRQRMISEAAYRRYAERNYADGYDLDDWLQAEAEIDSLLRSPRGG